MLHEQPPFIHPEWVSNVGLQHAEPRPALSLHTFSAAMQSAICTAFVWAECACSNHALLRALQVQCVAGTALLRVSAGVIG
jgi:hypothetical protein